MQIFKGIYPAGNYMFKVNNNKPLALFWCFYCELVTYFTLYSSLSIVNFEQVDASWVVFSINK